MWNVPLQTGGQHLVAAVCDIQCVTAVPIYVHEDMQFTCEKVSFATDLFFRPLKNGCLLIIVYLLFDSVALPVKETVVAAYMYA